MTNAPITIEEILKKTTDLPTMPAAVIAVMREADNSNSSAATIAKHLMQDQALSVRVLRLANSSYYGLTRQVDNIGESVVILGTRTIKHLCLVAATYPLLNRPLTGYDLGPKQLWKHSFATGIAAASVAEASKRVDKDVCFTGGLVHNLGKVALSVWLEGKAAMLQMLAQRNELTFDEVERRAFGFDHTDVGAHLADRWNLPETLIQVIKYHHRPGECKPAPSLVVDAVHIGDCLASSMGYGLGADGLRYQVFAECFERLGILPDDLERISDDFTSRFEAEAKIFDLDEPLPEAA